MGRIRGITILITVLLAAPAGAEGMSEFIASVDRIEAGQAVVIFEPCGNQAVLPAAMLPASTAEGSLLRFHIRMAADLTQHRQMSMKEMLQKLTAGEVKEEKKSER